LKRSERVALRYGETGPARSSEATRPRRGIGVPRRDGVVRKADEIELAAARCTADRYPWRLSLCGVARVDDSGFIGEHDGLDAVAYA
jgi:hypothetical protein